AHRKRSEASELSVQLFDCIGLGLGTFDPLNHVGKIHDRLAIVLAQAIDLDAVGDEARTDWSIHSIRHGRRRAEEIWTIITLEAFAPDFEHAIDVRLSASP